MKLSLRRINLSSKLDDGQDVLVRLDIRMWRSERGKKSGTNSTGEFDFFIDQIIQYAYNDIPSPILGG